VSDIKGGGLRVALACPTITRPLPAFLAAAEAAVPVLEAAGLDVKMVFEIGNPYISAARATMLRKAMDAKCDVVVFLDHDVSFRPEDLLKLIQTEGDVVSGLYRFKTSDEEYMGALLTAADGRPLVRGDGALQGHRIPAGFLKVTKEGVERFMRAYPELCYGSPLASSVDLFNHGAHGGVWYGEDYAFSRRWLDCGGQIWIIPDLDLHHHSADAVFEGNYHQFLMRQPGGVNDPARSHVL
jgi:glycosyltransferase involved in cell wall biosynthesis